MKITFKKKVGYVASEEGTVKYTARTLDELCDLMGMPDDDKPVLIPDHDGRGYWTGLQEVIPPAPTEDELWDGLLS